VEGKTHCRFNVDLLIITNTHFVLLQARFTTFGRTIFLGSFSSEQDAARRYDEFAELFGKQMNFPKRMSFDADNESPPVLSATPPQDYGVLLTNDDLPLKYTKLT